MIVPQSPARRVAIVLAAVAMLAIPCAARAALKAGAATSNVTPMIGAEIVGGWGDPKSETIHDELHARCLVLDDGATRLGFVVVDNVGIAREVFDAARKLIDERGEIPSANIIMSATHTHSAASARSQSRIKADDVLNDYQRFVASRIADGVTRAVRNLEPAQIAWGAGDEPRPLFNRRYFMKPGTELLSPVGSVDQVKMNPGVGNKSVVRPAGPTDPQVSFISVRSADGRPLALLANYSLHYVGGVGNTDISADYYGVFADKIQQRLGADRLSPPFVGIMSNGTSGDVNNINVLGGKQPARKEYEQINAVAEIVADAVARAHQEVRWHEDVKLQTLRRELPLKTRKPTAEQLERAKKILAGEEKPAVRYEEVYARRFVQLHEGPDEISAPLQVFRIGELGVAAIPFEVFTQSGLDIKSRSPVKPVFTISLANGSYGYLPTEEAHQLGGYETWLGTNNVQKDAATKIVQTLLAMFEELKDQPTK